MRIRRAFSLIVIFMVTLGVTPVAVAAATPSPEPTQPVAESPVRPLGGCVLGVCGKVVNKSTRNVRITMNWCCTDQRDVPPGGDTGGWGDVDGIFIYSGYVADVSINNLVSGGRHETWRGPQWIKIETIEIAFVNSQTPG
jgi:hypothetical protein